MAIPRRARCFSFSAQMAAEDSPIQNLDPEPFTAPEELVDLHWRWEAFPDDLLVIHGVPRARAAMLAPFMGVLREGAGFQGPASMTLPANLCEVFMAVSEKVDDDPPMTRPVHRQNAVIAMFSMLLRGGLGSDDGMIAMLLFEDYLLSADMRREWTQQTTKLCGNAERVSHYEASVCAGILLICVRLYVWGVAKHAAREVLLKLIRAIENNDLVARVQLEPERCFTAGRFFALTLGGARVLQANMVDIFRRGCDPRNLRRLAKLTGDLMWNTRVAARRLRAAFSTSGMFVAKFPGCVPLDYDNMWSPLFYKMYKVDLDSTPAVLCGKFHRIEWLARFLAENQKTALVAGSAPTAAMHRGWRQHYKIEGAVEWEPNDVDIFLVGSELVQTRTLVSLLADFIDRGYDRRSAYTVKNNVITIYIDDDGDDPKVAVQIISTHFATPQQVLLEFDQTYLQWGYNGEVLFGTVEAWMGLVGANWYTGARQNPSTALRRAASAVQRGLNAPTEELYVGSRGPDMLMYESMHEMRNASSKKRPRESPPSVRPLLTAVAQCDVSLEDAAAQDACWAHRGLTVMLVRITSDHLVSACLSATAIAPVSCSGVFQNHKIFIDLARVVHVDSRSFVDTMGAICVYLDIGSGNVEAFNNGIGGPIRPRKWVWAEERPDTPAGPGSLVYHRIPYGTASSDGIAPVYLARDDIEWHQYGTAGASVMFPLAKVDGAYSIHDVVRTGDVLQLRLKTFLYGPVPDTEELDEIFAGVISIDHVGNVADERLAALMHARSIYTE